jgi:hypothetical protein
MIAEVYFNESQETVDLAYDDYQCQYITEDEYHLRLVEANQILEYHITDGWKQLSPEDQITYYLKCNHQACLSRELTEEQKTAIIIIQDQLVAYD